MRSISQWTCSSQKSTVGSDWSQIRNQRQFTVYLTTWRDGHFGLRAGAGTAIANKRAIDFPTPAPSPGNFTNNRYDNYNTITLRYIKLTQKKPYNHATWNKTNYITCCVCVFAPFFIWFGVQDCNGFLVHRICFFSLYYIFSYVDCDFRLD